MSEDLVKTVLDMVARRGKANVTIEGYIDIPVKSFGVIKMWTLELNYVKSMEVDVVKTVL